MRQYNLGQLNSVIYDRNCVFIIIRDDQRMTLSKQALDGTVNVWTKQDKLVVNHNTSVELFYKRIIANFEGRGNNVQGAST